MMVTGQRLRLSLEGAATLVSPSGQSVWKHIGMWGNARSCLPVERWVAPHQRVGALLNSYLRLLNPTQVPLVTLLMCSQVHSRCHIGG